MERRRFLAACATAGLAGCARAIREPPATSPANTPAGSTKESSPSTDATGTATTETTGTSTRTPVHPEYEDVEVRVTTPGGTVLGSVTAAVADTPDLRYRGLSDTESLPEDRGMLFVYDEVDDRTFVMRDMDFGIDIVFADDERTITTIHHAPEPGPDEDGSEQTYPGHGRYVLEVNYDWTTERDVGEGDVLDFAL